MHWSAKNLRKYAQAMNFIQFMALNILYAQNMHKIFHVIDFNMTKYAVYAKRMHSICINMHKI